MWEQGYGLPPTTGAFRFGYRRRQTLPLAYRKEPWHNDAWCLGRSDQRPTLFFSHKSPFFGDPVDPALTNSSLRIKPRERLFALLAAYRVSVYACGHDHVYQTVRHRGIKVIWAPATSFVHRLPKPGTRRGAKRITGFVRFALDGRRAQHDCIEPESLVRFDVTQ